MGRSADFNKNNLKDVIQTIKHYTMGLSTIKVTHNGSMNAYDTQNIKTHS